MKKLFGMESFSIGLAMFAMFFGAGNIIFPLAVGQYAGDKNFFAMLGLIITAAFMPIAGVIAMILFDGNKRDFFGRLGRGPGFLLALLIISLLGPLGSTPRCVNLAYVTLKNAFLIMNPIAFNAIACFTIFIFALKKNRMIRYLGLVLTPLLLAGLGMIIVLGLLSPSEMPNVSYSNLDMFFHGLKEGYNTMDLLAAFFFSSTILAVLKSRFSGPDQDKSYLQIAFGASLIGAVLLSAVYIGFSYLAAFHGQVTTVGKENLLSAITLKIAGPYGGFLVCITIALACFTTAVALISAFSDFIQHRVFKEKVSYGKVLAGSCLATFFVANFEFTGISAFLGPILQICYPGLILLTFLNIAYRLREFKPIKVPVFCAFALAALGYLY